MAIRQLRFLATFFLLSAAAVWGQGLTGQIDGTVRDSSGNVIPGAQVELINEATGERRTATTGPLGNFVYNLLLPGTYTVTASFSGFKKLEKKGVILSATERLAVGDLQLEVGAVTESVTVEAQVARIQTQSAERSGLISFEQVQNLSLKGRDYMGLLRLMPGVVDTANRSVADRITPFFSSFLNPEKLAVTV